MINGIVANAEKEKIAKNPEGLEFSRKLMKKEIKSYLARDLYDKGDFYRIYNEDDDAILKAVEILKNGAYFSYLGSK